MKTSFKILSGAKKKKEYQSMTPYTFKGNGPPVGPTQNYRVMRDFCEGEAGTVE